MNRESKRLLMACEQGDLSVVQRLVRSGVDPSTNWDFPARAYRHEKSALMWATRFNHPDIVRYLVDAGADCLYAIEWDGNVLHTAAFYNRSEIGKFLLSATLDIESRNDPWHETPLHVASAQLSLEFVMMLIDNGADVNARDHIGCTPVDNAGLYADRRTFNLLQTHGGEHGRLGQSVT